MELQEGDFNLATSSIQALSNSFTLTRGEKIAQQSPHSSPRLPRKNAAQSPADQNSSSSNVKLSNGRTKSSSSASTSSSSSSLSSRPLSDSLETPSNSNNAPPLPPRKAQADRSLKPHQPLPPTNLLVPIRETPPSPPELLPKDFPPHVPATPITPPVVIANPAPLALPVHAEQLPVVPPRKCEDLLLMDEDIISFEEESFEVGPAETISGVIDCLSQEQRNYISFASLTNNVTSDFNLTTVGEDFSNRLVLLNSN